MNTPEFRPAPLVIRLLVLAAIASAGLAVTTSRVDPASIASLSARIDASSSYELVLFFSIAAATLVSEDLTCIAAGMLAGEGHLRFWFATFACMSGIFVGDILLFLTGRLFGRRALNFRVVRAFVTEEKVREASEWLNARGFKVILVSRFMPGTRLPVYFAAGVLETSFVAFSRWFLAAVAVWTPILVAIAAQWNAFASRIDFRLASLVASISALILWILTMDWKSRRLLLARWRRLTRWEFWPTWLFYLPVIAWTMVLAVRHRSARCFTAVNPAIPGGGIIGESKSQILQSLESADAFVPRGLRLEASTDAAARASHLMQFMNDEALDFPIVLKPDAGQRGSGVVIARTRDDVERYFGEFHGVVLGQDYVAGEELGVFYVRHPGSEKGSIFSITRKTFTSVKGDGSRTLEELILADDRAVCQAEIHLERNRERLGVVPADGETVRLVELGTHCRGSLFTDGGDLETQELADAIDHISRSFEGFFFGRYDIRGESIDAIRAGRFKVIELNGVTSEATAVYDPSNTLLSAWRTLFRQWSLAFEIGAWNAKRGHAVTRIAEIVESVREYRKTSRRHPAS